MQPYDEEKEEPKGSGVFLWFDWEEISSHGHHTYGRFIYERLLPMLQIRVYNLKDLENLALPAGRYEFFNGDAIVEEGFSLKARELGEEDVLEKVSLDNFTSMFVIAIFAWEKTIDYARLDSKVRNILGYIGKTSFREISFKEMYQLTGELALPYAFTLNFETIEKESFDFFSDDQLQQMGFIVWGSRLHNP